MRTDKIRHIVFGIGIALTILGASVNPAAADVKDVWIGVNGAT